MTVFLANIKCKKDAMYIIQIVNEKMYTIRVLVLILV